GSLRDPDPLPLGEWTHVAATYSEESGEARLFRNGRIVAEDSFAGKLRPSQHPLNLGASQGGGDRFDGHLDEARIYARALAPEEIQAHYEGREIAPPQSAVAGMEPLPVCVHDDSVHVDYAALCARNDLVYLQPAVYPFEAMHLGNGNLGVCLWNEAGVTWQLNNGSYRRANEPVSSGKVTLTTPALRAAKPDSFVQRTCLWDGVVTTRTESGAGKAELLSFVAEDEDLLVARCLETGSGPRELTLHLWRDTAHFTVGSDFVALTEHADHPETFLATDMAMLVKVDGAQVTAARRDAHTLTLTLSGEPAVYTVYVANPLVRGTEAEALAAAQASIARARSKGFDKLLAERQAFWHEFWPKSFLHITSPRGEGDFLENHWHLFFYDLASMSRRTLCPKFNGGNWLVEKDSRWWGGGYWHQNTREIFWPAYAANRVELTQPFFDLYGRAAACARENGRVGLGVDGYYIPEWIPINVAAAKARRQIQPPGGYTAFIFTVGLEVSLQAWWRYEFTGDERFLREHAYPLLKGSLDFYLNYAKKGADGKYHIEPADAQESYWLVKDPAQDLAALRWGLPLAMTVSEKLGVDAEMRPRWRDLLENLAPFSVDQTKNLIREADLVPDAKRHNSENVADYAIYPFAVFGIGKPDYELAKNTFLNRPVPGMGNGWEPAAICAARLGLADEAAKLVLAHMNSNLRFNSGGWYSPTGIMFAGMMPDVPYFDSPGVNNQAIQEMALQTHDGVLRIAPAWPARWQAQFRLLARGGFMVTAELDRGQVRYALIESQRGGCCTLANPWPDTALVACSSREVLRSNERLLTFETQAGKSYRLERASAPLSAMPFARLSPKANAGPKFIGSRLPEYPRWNSPAYLGIDERGQTPQRAAMIRAVQGFNERLAKATAGLTDLSTGKATASVTRSKSEPLSSASLVDGVTGPGNLTAVAHQESVVVDLGAERQVSAVVFSRDRTGLFVDGPADGYTLEVSTDGVAWQLVADHPKTQAAPVGQIEAFATPAPARSLRLRLLGRYNGPIHLDEITVYGK
ncbi:MAG: discoidin domain-containing protein, partial [Pirellulaceae bacterium]|nr:discoidin domain-containing protein [Pirellulaceae bacterium]